MVDGSNQGVLNKPSGFLVCTIGEEEEEDEGFFQSKLWSPVICHTEDLSGSKQSYGANWELSHIILFV